MEQKKKKERLSVEHIANLLVKKLNNMERTAVHLENTAKAIQEAKKTPVSIDTEEMRNIANEHLKLIEKKTKELSTMQNAFLSDLSDLKIRNQSRVPNWIIICLMICFIGSIASMLFFFGVFK